MDLLTNPEMWMALATLTLLELVLGIDNIIFISILVSKLPKAKQEMARRIGLFMAMFLRIALLLLLSYIIGLVEPLFSVMGQPFSGRDLILLAGGLFLIWKSTAEIHQSLEGEETDHATGLKVKANVMAIIAQIIIIDLVFSLDLFGIDDVVCPRHRRICRGASVYQDAGFELFGGGGRGLGCRRVGSPRA